VAIWAIADIHASRTDPLSGQPSKPMDIFGDQWKGHLQRLRDAWVSDVQETDTIIVAGDIDWALHLDDARETLELLASLPGEKILIRGNHDYWWSSKTTNRVRRALPPTLSLLHNNAFVREGFNICGAKGSPVPGSIDWTPSDEKILNREVGRLEESLRQRDAALETIVAMHYPPFYRGHPASPYRDVLEQHGVQLCVYGHLHGGAAASGPQGAHGGIGYMLVAGDAVDFHPVLLASKGTLSKVSQSA